VSNSSNAVGRPDYARGQAAEAPSRLGAVTRQPPLLILDDDALSEDASEQSGPVFTVRCLGPFEVATEEGPLEGWTIQKAREMLAYLIARGGVPMHRDKVAEALWPEGEPSQVDHFLWNASYYLRRMLRAAAPSAEAEAFGTSGQRHRLQIGVFRVDVDTFDAHLRRARDLSGAEALGEFDQALATIGVTFWATSRTSGRSPIVGNASVDFLPPPTTLPS